MVLAVWCLKLHSLLVWLGLVRGVVFQRCCFLSTLFISPGYFPHDPLIALFEVALLRVSGLLSGLLHVPVLVSSVLHLHVLVEVCPECSFSAPVRAFLLVPSDFSFLFFQKALFVHRFFSCRSFLLRYTFLFLFLFLPPSLCAMCF